MQMIEHDLKAVFFDESMAVADMAHRREDTWTVKTGLLVARAIDRVEEVRRAVLQMAINH